MTIDFMLVLVITYICRKSTRVTQDAGPSIGGNRSHASTVSSKGHLQMGRGHAAPWGCCSHPREPRSDLMNPTGGWPASVLLFTAPLTPY